MTAQLTAIKNLTDQITSRYQQFFNVTVQDYLLEKQTKMPEFQRELFVKEAIRNRKAVTIQIDKQDDEVEVVTGMLTNGPHHQLLIQNPSSNLTKLIFRNKIRYISAL
ncbi:hypothetical protein LOSG293_010260 [Secundilactobacillus oryzae JCM 18671]|uniref:Uncharacterized protein n=1 Tax=Secundilactobacillus oryzae JCM 18671 TaxID=1291743 RepID=A0A081BFW0_9LACO|nr:hypothetical protein [Secundilactobacillus oryzae]GAK46928.1 hypothetical protein LOSG293_010260 [Secundilactobacillus oryzae JCM 18671]